MPSIACHGSQRLVLNRLNNQKVLPKKGIQLKSIIKSMTCDSLIKDFIYLFLERGERRENKRERNINVKEKH